MYKKQMNFQKLVCIAALFCSVLVFIYSLGIMTDLYDCLYSTITDQNNPDQSYVTGARVYYDMQPFNRQLLVWSIVLIIASCLLLVFQTDKRRRYYASNYIASGLFAGLVCYCSVWVQIKTSFFKKMWLAVNFDELKQFSDLFKTAYTESTFWFDAHYVVFGLCLVVAGLLIFNLVWKTKLMKQEALLVKEGGNC